LFEEASVGGGLKAEHSTAGGQLLARLRTAKAWVFDMDGVMYRGTDPLPGVSDLLEEITRRGYAYMLATNNSMSTPESYVKKLAGLQIEVPSSAILTSAIATRFYLSDHFPAGTGFFVVGMPALAEQLFADGVYHQVTTSEHPPAGVIVGLDKAFTYDKLATVNGMIRGGAQFIATNTDATLPTESGLIPGCGALIAAIQTATGVEPVIIGKPEPLMLQMALRQMGVHPSEAVMVGDRLDTDIIAGHRAEMMTLLVLTGVSTREEIATAPVRPDLVFSDLTAVLETLLVDGV
jgi:4-nitrophenyl phosphatase